MCKVIANACSLFNNSRNNTLNFLRQRTGWFRLECQQEKDYNLTLILFALQHTNRDCKEKQWRHESQLLDIKFFIQILIFVFIILSSRMIKKLKRGKCILARQQFHFQGIIVQLPYPLFIISSCSLNRHFLLIIATSLTLYKTDYSYFICKILKNLVVKKAARK